MQYIHKNQALREPKSVRNKREIFGSTYDGLDKSEIRPVLLEEQHGLCAYCLCAISEGNMHIEHFKSQKICKETDPKEAMMYTNMLGVCSGKTGSYYHCDKANGPKGKQYGHIELKKLDPRKSDIESKLTYGTNGEIKSKSNDPNVQDELDEVLNLNNPKLKEFRKARIDNAKSRMEREYGRSKDWKQRQFELEIDWWKRKKKPYYTIAVWWLNKQARRRS